MPEPRRGRLANPNEGSKAMLKAFSMAVKAKGSAHPNTDSKTPGVSAPGVCPVYSADVEDAQFGAGASGPWEG
jgi:hypothetical protein